MRKKKKPAGDPVAEPAQEAPAKEPEAAAAGGEGKKSPIGKILLF